MSPSGPQDMLSIDWEKLQSSGGHNSDDESCYEWKDVLCIILESGNYIEVNIEDSEVNLRKMDKILGPKFDEDKTFHKMRIGIKPGTMWCKMFDWEVEDYKNVLNNEYIMSRLENNITPNPTYIHELKQELRELQINKIL